MELVKLKRSKETKKTKKYFGFLMLYNFYAFVKAKESLNTENSS